MMNVYCEPTAAIGSLLFWALTVPARGNVAGTEGGVVEGKKRELAVVIRRRTELLLALLVGVFRITVTVGEEVVVLGNSFKIKCRQ